MHALLLALTSFSALPAAPQVSAVLEAVDGTTQRHELQRTPGAGGLDLAAGDWAFMRFEGVARGPSPDGADEARLALRVASPAREDLLLGRPSGGGGDRLEFRLAVGATLTVDVERLRSLVFPGRIGAAEGSTLEPAASGDRLYWRREGGLDRIDGTLEEFTARGVRFESLLGSREFAWDELAALFVAALGQLPQPEPDAPGVPVICDLADGGRLRGRALAVAAEGLRLSLQGGGTLTLPLAGILEVAVDDGRMVYLSDLAPSVAEEGSPFDDDLGLRWPHQLDRSVTGRALTVGGRTWRRGIGVHAPASLSWELDGSWKGLHGSVGIDDEVLALPHKGAVEFRVLVDGGLVWKSGTLRGGDGAKVIPTVALAGARKLTLEVSMDAHSFVADRADWLRMLLVR